MINNFGVDSCWLFLGTSLFDRKYMFLYRATSVATNNAVASDIETDRLSAIPC